MKKCVILVLYCKKKPEERESSVEESFRENVSSAGSTFGKIGVKFTREGLF